MIKVKCKLLHPDAKLPTQAYEYDAGWDLYATEDVIIPFGKCTEVHTRVCFEIPPGWVGIVFTRSSYGKEGKVVHHGVIDSGYRNEVSIFIRNSSQCSNKAEAMEILKGDKIAQIIFFRLPKTKLIQVDKLSKSERGKKGYGSSGR
jgi:dUTP pyrophosphatase